MIWYIVSVRIEKGEINVGAGWTVYYIAHLLAATNPVIFGHWVYPAGHLLPEP